MAEQQVATQQQPGQPAPESAERTRTRPVFAPRTDIYETDQGLVMLIDLPGVGPDGAEVMLEGDTLTIRGRTQDRPPAGFSPIYREYQPGDFERVFTLSDELDAGRIEAQAKDGVLRLLLPKVGPAQTKRIQVQAS